MLRNCPELTTPTFSFDLPKHGVLQRIPTTGFPVHCQARRLSPEKLKITKEEFDTLLKLGIIRRSNSPYSSLLHVAPKPGGGAVVETTAGEMTAPNLTVIQCLEYTISQQIWREKDFFEGGLNSRLS